jgi:hypothetical protein
MIQKLIINNKYETILLFRSYFNLKKNKRMIGFLLCLQLIPGIDFIEIFNNFIFF